MKRNIHNIPRLTLKTARELAIQELGTAKGLAKDTSYSGQDVYSMSIGNLHIHIRMDWMNSDSRCIAIEIRSMGGNITMLFNRETLREDFGEEERQKAAIRKEDFETRVDEIGIEGCQKIIDRLGG
jgi:hypothetical protein